MGAESDELLPGYVLDETGEVKVDITRRDIRWKLAGGTLPLYERHLRSLVAFGYPSPLCSWIRTRLEWSIENQTVDNPEGVVHIFVNDKDEVDVRIEAARDISELADDECTCWEVRGHAGGTQVLVPLTEPLDAAATLLRDLASTLGLEVVYADRAGEFEVVQERFRTSDEFGFIVDEPSGPVSTKMAACFDKLWANARGDE